MKTFQKCLTACLLTVMVLSLFVLGAFAETATQDGLTVELTTDKATYGAGESITAILTVTNTNNVPMQSVVLKQLVPAGYQLSEGQTDTKSVMDLQPGQSISLSVMWTGVDQPDEGFDLMKFYENNKTLVHIVGIALGGILLVVLVALGIHKLRYSFIALVLCSTMLFGAVSGTVVQVQALGPVEGSVKVSATVTADGKEVKLEGTADYSMEPEVTTEAVCTVTFDTMGGSAVEPQQVDNGGLAVRPDVPTREGHVFVGWYADAELENLFDFTTPITSSCTVYAKWLAPSMTRAEWIHTLIDLLDCTMEVEVSEPSFTDIVGIPYEKDVEQAVIQGILTKEADQFYPNAGLTREFAVVTAILGLGFQVNEKELQCNDVADIDNPSYVQFALDVGMASLDNGYFYPDFYITEDDIKVILNFIIEIQDSIVPKEDDEYEGIQYRDNVIVLPNNSGLARSSADMQEIYEHTEDGRIKLPYSELTAGFKEGDIVRTSDNIHAFKVVSTEISGDYVLIEYVQPELGEVVESINVGGEGTANIEEFIPTEGVEVIAVGSFDEVMREEPEPVVVFTNVLVNNSRLATSPSTCGWGDDWFDVPSNDLDKELGLGKFIHLRHKIKLGSKTDLEYDIYLAVKSVEYGLDIDFEGLKPVVKNAYVLTKTKLKSTLVIKRTFSSGPLEDDLIYTYLDRKTLGSLPIIGADGLGMVVELDFVYNFEGTFELEFTADTKIGVQVIDNEVRNLSFSDTDITPKFAATLKVGFDLNLAVEFLDKNVLYAGAQIGVAIEGSLTIRSGLRTCLDAAGYLYFEIALMRDTIINDWLSCEIVVSIFTRDNSPWVMPITHWEDFSRVDECTYSEQGILKGKVVNASKKSQCIPNACIKVYAAYKAYELLETVYSDANGMYEIRLDDGLYNIVVSADGYIPFDCAQYVSAGNVVYVETFLMVEGDEGSDEKGTINGKVTNAVTGYNVSNVDLIIRKGWANASGDDIITTTKTDTSGRYSLELPVGNYTILMEKDKYISNYINVAVTAEGNMEYNGVITPSGDSEIPVGDLRVVLTWGSTPRDLDSHMFGPTANGSGEFHVYFSEKRYYYGGTTHCFLDVDDTTSYGPETVTVYSMENSGVYHYYVHDYTNKNSGSSKAMSNSEAKVQVFIGDQMVMSFNIPVDQAGTIWHVFDYDSEFGLITPVNTISNSYDH